ncbi:MAG: hypothetical protein JWN22_2423 [Nocardioides sp.]|nr:hypothetical protein [Nocardioides sp.]
MSVDTAGTLVLVLLGACVVAGLVAWTPAGRRIWVPPTVALLAAAALLAAVAGPVEVAGRGGHTLLVVLAGLVAVVGGGPVTGRVFDLVDRDETPGRSMDRAGQVLRGGAWIGALERGAILASLVAGWPEGLAVVLAVKGLGRYPELRAAEDGVRTGAAERFIIGTFASVLWACACAGVVVLVRG